MGAFMVKSSQIVEAVRKAFMETEGFEPDDQMVLDLL